MTPTPDITALARADDLVKHLEVQAETELADKLNSKWWYDVKNKIPPPIKEEMLSWQAAARITALEAALKDARREGREEAAKVADIYADQAAATGKRHPENSESRDRCFARARQATDIAAAIRALNTGDGKL